MTHLYGISDYLKRIGKLFCQANWIKYRMLLIVVCIIKASPVGFARGSRADSLAIYNASQNNTKIKFSRSLGIILDSICCVQLYEVIDKWLVFINKNPQKLKLQYECVFVQFVYYLAYNTRIPSDFKSLYNNTKTYRFKNPQYLRVGDLVFWGESAKNQTSVALFLQNNMLVYPNADGSLNFSSLESVKGKNVIVPAKIIKDE